MDVDGTGTPANVVERLIAERDELRTREDPGAAYRRGFDDGWADRDDGKATTAPQYKAPEAAK